MNRKFKITILILAMLVAFASLIGTTYSFLTDQQQSIIEYQIDTLQMTTTVTGNVTINSTLTSDLDDLAYIHCKDDLVLDRFKLLDAMSSEIKINIVCNNNINTRPNIKIPEVEGLVFFVIVDSDPTKAINVETTDGMLRWKYADSETWTTVADFTSQLASTESAPFTAMDTAVRSAITTYNTTTLQNLYTGTKLGPTGSLNLRLVVWGDYYNLGATSATSQANYLSQTFTIAMNIKTVQAIDDYGGTLDYAND